MHATWTALKYFYVEVVADGERNYRRDTSPARTLWHFPSRWEPLKRNKMAHEWSLDGTVIVIWDGMPARLLIKLFAQEMLVTSGTRLLHRELIPLASIMFLWSEMNSQRANSAQQTSCLDFLFLLFRQKQQLSSLGPPEFFFYHAERWNLFARRK